MDIVVNKTTSGDTMYMRDMEMHRLYEVTAGIAGNISGGNKGHIVIRVYDDIIVSLTNPVHTWSITESCRGARVKPLPEGSAITLIQE